MSNGLSSKLKDTGVGIASAIAIAIKSSLKGFIKGAFKLDVENWDDSYVNEMCQRSSQELEQANSALRALISGTEEGTPEHEIAKHLVQAVNETSTRIPEFGESVKSNSHSKFLVSINNDQVQEGTNKFLLDSAKFDYKVFTQDSLNNPERKKELITTLQSCFSKHGTPITASIREKQVVEFVNNLEDIANLVDPKTPASKQSALESTVDIDRMGLNKGNIEIVRKAVQERTQEKISRKNDQDSDSIYSTDNEGPSGP